VQRAQDLIDQQCVLNSRHKDIQTVQTWTWTKKFVMCARSAAYSVMGLHVNTMLSRCKETWAGSAWRAWGGAWLGTCGQHWTYNGNIHVLFAGARVMGVSMVIAARGEGVMCAIFPPPPHRITCLSPETRVKNCRVGLLMLYMLESA
jgi:hypothetical protein